MGVQSLILVVAFHQLQAEEESRLDSGVEIYCLEAAVDPEEAENLALEEEGIHS